jgi:predicted acyl esterase
LNHLSIDLLESFMSVDDPSRDVRQGVHMVEIRRDLRIPTADPQATLSADLYLPAGADPVPALVTVIPYRKDFLGGISLHAALRCFAERGYACLLVDSRGTGSSDGLPRPKFDSGEGDDAVAAIEWAAAQPWCTGNVGMWGISIGGFATMRAASRRPPNLKAIIPIMTPLDPGREAVHHDGARVDLNQRALWSGSMLVQQLLPPLLNYTSVQEQRRWYQRLHETEPFIVDLARHGPGDPVWQERVIDAASSLRADPGPEEAANRPVDAHHAAGLTLRADRFPLDCPALVGSLATRHRQRGDGRAAGHPLPARQPPRLAFLRILATREE